MISNAYNRDCMEAMREFPDNYFELAVVDPPYGAGFTETGGCQGWFAKYHQDSSQTVQVERERERETGGARPRLNLRVPGSVEPVVSSWTQTECPCTESRETLPDSLPTPGTTGVRSSSCRRMQYRDSLCLADHGVRGDSSPECRHQGFQAQISPWCRKLKIDKVKTPFRMSAPRGAETEISWNT